MRALLRAALAALVTLVSLVLLAQIVAILSGSTFGIVEAVLALGPCIYVGIRSTRWVVEVPVTTSRTPSRAGERS